MATGVGGFDADAFIAGIHTAMQVGLPPEEENQPTFFWRPSFVETDPLDDEGVPFNPAVQQEVTPFAPRRVPCAYEYSGGAGKIVDFGVSQPSRVTLTLLQGDYDLVFDPDRDGMFWYVVIGGARWYYSKELVPYGMVSVGIHQIECTAEDDT